MGCVPGIDFDNFPEQTEIKGRRVAVCYHYDSGREHQGVCIRDDKSAPYQTIFQLDNGRVVLATECQYHWLDTVR